jgi:hypothetical protein
MCSRATGGAIAFAADIDEYSEQPAWYVAGAAIG